MKKLFVILFLLAPFGSSQAIPTYDFLYEYGDPFSAHANQYIDSTSNAVLYDEGLVRYWKPNVGATTFANTTPGIINYHFNFGQISDEISLWMSMPTFHWSYSQGHNFLYGSTDGSSWITLAEVLPPTWGGARDLGTVSIPTSLLGAQDLWLRVALYSYGTSAPKGGAMTNTSQLSRWDERSPSSAVSFRLGANFLTTTVPEPATFILLSLSLVGLGFGRHRKG